MNTNNIESLVKQHGKDNVIRSLQTYFGYSATTYIPTIDEFIEDDYYLGRSTDNGKGIYPYWREKLREIFPNPLTTNYDTVLLRSAIGTGKSVAARICILYTMAKVILMDDPHSFFGLLKNKDLVVFFYALSDSTISGAMYSPTITMIDASPFFKANMDLSFKGYRFKNKVVIKKGTSIAKNVGLDVFAVYMDEIQVERIRNQNINNYNSLKARVKSRFMLDGGVFFNSIIVLAGSPGSAESFAEKLTDKNETDTKSLIISTPQWEVLKEKLKYSGVNFKVFIGNDSNEPKIIDDKKDLEFYEESLGELSSKYIIDVPIEYRKEFEDDILIAIRDLAGSVTRSVHSFITNHELLNRGFSLPRKIFGSDYIKVPFFGPTSVSDYIIENKEKTLKQRLLNPDSWRFIHIDLGVVSDLAGVAMSHISDFIERRELKENGELGSVIRDPIFINDFNLGLSRSKNEETSISKIRDFIIYLRDAGVPIYKVTIDGYQSTQLRQDLIVAGIDCEVMSVTRTSTPFDTFKRFLYMEHIKLPVNELAKQEFKNLKKQIKGNKVKIVHPPTTEAGSHGDVAEAITGSVYSAYTSFKAGLDVLSGFTKYGNGYIGTVDENMTPQQEFDLLCSSL